MIYQFRWRLACLVATLIHQASIYRIIHKSQACSIRNDRHDVTSSSYSRRNRTWWYGLRLLLEYGLEFEVQGQSSSPGGSRPHSSWHCKSPCLAKLLENVVRSYQCNTSSTASKLDANIRLLDVFERRRSY